MRPLRLLDENFLNALALPTELQAFGPATRLEMEPLGQAIRRELQRHAMNEVRLFLAGSAEAWEPLDWQLRDDLIRFKNTGMGVHFILSQNSFAQLTPSQRDELAALTAISDAAVYLPNTMPETSEARHRLPLIVEIGNAQHAIRWAASHTDAMAPTSHWGG